MNITEEVKNRFNEKYKLGSTPWTKEPGYKYIAKYVSLLKKKNPRPCVLDLGCGDGWVSLYCAKLGVVVVGIDSSPIAIAQAKRLAREQGLKHATFKVGDALAVPYKKPIFDGVIDRGMLHHQPSSVWPTYRKQLERVLKPGGLVFLGVFDADAMKPGQYKGVKGQLGYKYKDSLTGLWSYDRYFNDVEAQKAFGKNFKMVARSEQARKVVKTSLINYIFEFRH